MLKRIAWRVTAIYVWLRIISLFFGGDRFLQALTTFIITHAIALLGALGFVTVSGSHFGLVLKVGWVLIVTGFSPVQLAAFFIYLVSFPIWFLFYAFFRKEISQLRVQQGFKPGLRPAKVRRPAVALFGSALLGWYALFGNTSSSRASYVAVFLSGVLMILLAYRAFRRAAPTSDSDATVLPNIERQALSVITNVGRLMAKYKEALPALPERSDIYGNRKIYQGLRYYFVSLAANMRRKRIYTILVLHYALSLIFLDASAVLFWTFAIKAISPAQFQLSQCLLVSVSHFLPGIVPPAMPSPLPMWVALGPGFTALVLLGIYVGASASLLPGKQAAYAQRAQTTYLCIRKCVAAIKMYLRAADAVLKRTEARSEESRP